MPWALAAFAIHFSAMLKGTMDAACSKFSMVMLAYTSESCFISRKKMICFNGVM